MNSDQMRKDILALMKLKNAMEDETLKALCREEITQRLIALRELQRMDNLHKEALIWNEAHKFFSA